MTGEPYFPPRPERPVLEDVIAHFPFPLAITYARLHEEMDRDEPVAAAWRLRDAFECLIKFTASLAVADTLHSTPDPILVAKLAELLFKPMALGDWVTLLDRALKPLAPLAQSGRLPESRRCLPETLSRLLPAPRRQPDQAPQSARRDADQFRPLAKQDLRPRRLPR